MGKAEIKFIRVPKWVTVTLLLLVSAAMVGAIYALSGRAYVQESASLATLVSLMRRETTGRAAVLAAISPFILDILFFMPWGALAFLAIDREGFPRRRSYLVTLLIGVAFALGLSAWQATLPTRVTGWVDSAWNAAGCLAGAMAGHMRKLIHVRFE